MATRDKIYVSKKQEIQGYYERLTGESGDLLIKPFRFERDVFLAAAVTGYLKNQYVPLEPSEGKDKFVWGTLLNEQHALPALQAIALCRTKDPAVLLDDDAVASIAEGYANGGIHLLARQLLESGTDELVETAIYMSEVLEQADE